MEHKFCVHPLKFAISAVATACFAIICGCLLYINRWGSAVVFFAFASVFFALTIANGATVHINSTRIWRTVFGAKTKEIYWNDVADVVVSGTKVFNQNHPERTGDLYIYFSPHKLTEEEHFDTMLKWPPSDKIYLLYNEVRILSVQMVWTSKLKTFNVGNLF